MQNRSKDEMRQWTLSVQHSAGHWMQMNKMEAMITFWYHQALTNGPLFWEQIWQFNYLKPITGRESDISYLW